MGDSGQKNIRMNLKESEILKIISEFDERNETNEIKWLIKQRYKQVLKMKIDIENETSK